MQLSIVNMPLFRVTAFLGLTLCVNTSLSANNNLSDSRNTHTYSIKSSDIVMQAIPKGVLTRIKDNKKTIDKITIAPFYMMKTEVAWRLFNQCIKEKHCKNNKHHKYSDIKQYGNYPVTNVNINDIKTQFIPWLHQKLNIKKNSPFIFKLPSIEQWEYAAKAGSNTKYWWGDKISCSNAQYFGNIKESTLDNATFFYLGKVFQRCPNFPARKVGAFKPNPLGLYDMNGNVSEWTSTCKPVTFKNQKNAISPHVKQCAVKGGSWNSTSRHVSSSAVNWRYHSIQNNRIGFRLVQQSIPVH